MDRAKCGKAYLEIPNEVMKNKNAKSFTQIINLRFVTGLNPSVWDYSKIKPMPKPDKDPRDPLQNRCLTVMCCVAQIYSSIFSFILEKQKAVGKRYFLSLHRL